MAGNKPAIEIQQAFWNQWNATARENEVGDVSLEQAAVIVAWLERMGRRDLDIIDVGCGAGWLCARLTPFGHVTGTDLSDEVLSRAARRTPAARFVAGDFMTLDLGRACFDVAVSLEVLSHVADQPAFIARIAGLLRPGGHLMLATQNKFALMRNSVSPPAAGQLRRWVDRTELARLLAPHLDVVELFSITPRFNRGLLRIVNSGRLSRIAASTGLAGAMRSFHRLEERLWLGWTLMALARKRPA